jgi:hypothetical protein
MVCVISSLCREVAEFWVITQNNPKEKVSFGFLNPEDGTYKLSRNAGKKLPILMLLQFSGLWFVKHDSVFMYYSTTVLMKPAASTFKVVLHSGSVFFRNVGEIGSSFVKHDASC